MHRPMLEADEAANLAVPEVTCEAGRFRVVETKVSRVLAVR